MMRVSTVLFLISTFFSAFGQGFATNDYSKREVYIEMRDGIKLFTTIYQPKDTTQDYPVLIKRTPYSVHPYGPDTLPEQIMHNPHLIASGYIFVFQDMRGRYMSEGDFENTKPPYSFSDTSKTDEVTDSYDTFDWLVKNLSQFNGNIGQFGNSYLGYTSLVSSVSGHPNLKAVLAMAPVTNFYFEDFNRYGLFGLNYLPVLDVFGLQTDAPTPDPWYNVIDKPHTINADAGLSVDYYDFFLKRMALKNFDDIIDKNNFFWENIRNHPDYDTYRQERDWISYLDRAQCQALIVGGWNDEQNLYGIINAFKELYTVAPGSNVKLVMGPWSHGHPRLRNGSYSLGNIFYGDSLCEDYQKNIEFRYFEYHLKNNGSPLDFTAKIFDMGTHHWNVYNNNPFAAEHDEFTYYLNPDGSLSTNPDEGKLSFVSDPYHPVPFIQEDNFYFMAPKHYMNDDQRFVTKRNDVLTYISEPLTEDMIVSGEIQAFIDFCTDHQDADVYVKVIDVLPFDRMPEKTDAPGVKMNGYQKLVRAGYIRGRYRNSFENPEPFVPDEKDEVKVPLLEVHHTFKKGHRIMIQIQSSMFPLFDLNPQKYVKNIYNAEVSDFEKAVHSVFGSSRIVLPVSK